MLKELKHYENLGTPKLFWELLTNLNNTGNKWTIKNVEQYFYNRIIDGCIVFDGCIPLLLAIKVITNINNKIVIDDSFRKYLIDENYLRSKLIERLLSILNGDDDFHEIFCSENISYDIIYQSIQINNSSFRFEFASFKRLLLSFGFLQIHPDKKINKLIINAKYRKLFDMNILPEIKKRKLGLDELKKQLLQKQIYGEQAEKFVMDFEIQRLGNIKEPEQVSLYWPNAGYDISSFMDTNAATSNRFIEVKSFVGSPNFFWSRKEIDVARIKKGSYYLYLVDRNRINEPNYCPNIIKNPYEAVLKNKSQWSQQIEKYFITEIYNTSHDAFNSF